MLNHLLASLEVQVDAFALCEVYPGWRLKFGPDEEPSIHFVLAGYGAIHVPQQDPITLSQNTLVVLPRGTSHDFDGPGSTVREFRYEASSAHSSNGTAVPVIRAGADERRLSVACGTIRAAYGGSFGVFDHLEQPIVERFEANAFRDRFHAFLDELAAPSYGTRTLTEAFLKQAVVLVLRRQLKATNGLPAWLKMLDDPRVISAAVAMLQKPGDSFTLESLSAAAGMSRSPFAQNFAAAFGRSPMEFLKQIRLHHAARLLTMTDLPVKVISKSVGYDSRSYFSRAFRETYGVDPTDYRTGRSTRGAVTSAYRPLDDAAVAPSS